MKLSVEILLDNPIDAAYAAYAADIITKIKILDYGIELLGVR